MKTIELTKGYFSTVDEKDFDFLSRFSWCAQTHPRTTYAITLYDPGIGIKKIASMHRIIMGNPKGFEVDHIDGDGLNNLRENLRICTVSENRRNRRKLDTTLSQYKGVSSQYYVDGKPNRKWKATIRVWNKQIHIGSFCNEVDAAIAYDNAAREYFGKFARTNFNPL
jgi:hypothetical protein